MGCRQGAVLFGKPGKLEKTFELSVVDSPEVPHGGDPAVCARSSHRTERLVVDNLDKAIASAPLVFRGATGSPAVR